jgi:hypothetical protein
MAITTWTINGTYVLTFESEGGRRVDWQGGNPIEDVVQHQSSGNYTILDNGVGPWFLAGRMFVTPAHHTGIEALKALRLPVTVTRSTGGSWQAKISAYDVLPIIADSEGRYQGTIRLTRIGT